MSKSTVASSSKEKEIRRLAEKIRRDWPNGFVVKRRLQATKNRPDIRFLADPKIPGRFRAIIIHSDEPPSDGG